MAERIANLERELDECRETARGLRDVLVEMPDAVFVTDDDGAFCWVCPNVEFVLGYPMRELEQIGSLEDLLGTNPVDPEMLHTYGAVRNLEVEARARDGSIRRLLANLKTCDLFGGTVLTVLRDITERHAVELELAARELELERAQRMEAVGRLAGGVAHDFNNLLTAIFSFGAFLRDRFAEDPEARDDLDQVLAAASRGAELTRQLLSFSRQPIAEVQIVEPAERLEALSKLLVRLLGDDIELEIDTGELSWRLDMDPGGLDQIVVNLAVNARDAMPEGGTLAIRARHHVSAGPIGVVGGTLPAGEYVVLEVADTGHGIDPEKQASIFEPFFTTKAVGEGTGLGLSTSYGIAARAGGAFALESEPGRTVFEVYLPRYRGDDQTAPRPRSAAAPAAGGRERVLVIEDDEAIRESVTRSLAEGGYRVSAVSGGEPATEMLEGDESFDLVVADPVLPGLSGRALLEAIAERRPQLKLVLTSAFLPDPRLRRVVSAGAIAVVPKPFGPDELRQRIRAVLDSAAYTAGDAARALAEG